jgi:hypothetical protein
LVITGPGQTAFDHAGADAVRGFRIRQVGRDGGGVDAVLRRQTPRECLERRL